MSKCVREDNAICLEDRALIGLVSEQGKNAYCVHLDTSLY